MNTYNWILNNIFNNQSNKKTNQEIKEIDYIDYTILPESKLSIEMTKKLNIKNEINCVTDSNSKFK